MIVQCNLPGFVAVGRISGKTLAAPREQMNRCRLHLFYSGRVQGVGFRYTVREVAHGFEVTGMVRNLLDGRVELMAEGTRSELEAFQRAIRDAGLGALVRHEEAHWESAEGRWRGFEIAG